MNKIDRYRDPSDRRKARWELSLNPLVTMLILTFCIGILLVWIGLFESKVNGGDGLITPMVSNMWAGIKNWLSSIR